MGWGIIASVALSLVLLWALLVGMLWIFKPRDAGLRDLLRIVPDILRLVRRILADGSTPLGARLALLGLLLWLVNPIDLIPEFIPVLGPLDDVVVAVIVLRYVHRRLGPEEFRRRWPGTDEGYRLLAGVL
jgi:uncharacterized membrane protein YkvA (DUF1232 family)